VKEAASLIERAKKYLDSAEKLLDADDYESATSRAYYAMFYAAEAALLTKGLSFSSHKSVIPAFGEQFIKTGDLAREMGRELNRAFEKRQLADYEYTFVITRDEAGELVIQGRLFVDRVAEYLSKT
jgi:uncharacterized protein (UPF0332 family)